MSRHLSSDELLNRLYGVGDVSLERHVSECQECRRRYQTLDRRRAETAVEPSISTTVLAAQRRAIYARIDSAIRTPARWAPTLAAGVLLIAGVVFYRPLVHIAGRPPAVHAEISDEQLFAEVYSIEESVEPRAAAPIQELFETEESQ
jgi:predicted anti-sigma-YlaC factor YlaD